MANNTRFKALQTEAMSRLMATLMTNDQSLDQLTKKGLDFMKYSTELRKGFLEDPVRIEPSAKEFLGTIIFGKTLK